MNGVSRHLAPHPTERLITKDSPEWPAGLAEMAPLSSPGRLHVEGETLDASKGHVAVVGSRRPTASGLDAAGHFSKALAEAGFVVVSGLALGVDAAAHKAALDAGGHTVAVIACGLDIDYPVTNRGLRKRIRQCGTVITEYEKGTVPDPWRFPERNRVIAAISEAVIVVEGAERSGALITARHAIDMNRAVFALPGSRRNHLARGPNALIRAGEASLVTDIQHVFDEIAPGLVWQAGVQSSEGGAKLDREELAILSLLEEVPVGLERISSEVGMPAGKVALMMAKLEVRSWVRRGIAGYVLTDGGARVRSLAADRSSHR